MTRKQDDGDKAVAGASNQCTDNVEDETVEDDNSYNSDNSVSIHPHPNDPALRLHHHSRIASTQDEAKRIITTQLKNNNKNNPSSSSSFPFESFCVTTREQTNGRGTSGRRWIPGGSGGGDDSGGGDSGTGNTFVTIGIPISRWTSTRIPITLLPLKMGCLVANRLQLLLEKHIPNHNQSSPVVSVKWPNDILINNGKVSGILIEAHEDWFLVGIGVNLASAPVVPGSGPDHGRVATCLSDHIAVKNSNGDDDDGKKLSSVDVDWEQEARQLGVDLAYELHRFLLGGQQPPSGISGGIIEEWKSWVDWDTELVMRDTPGRERVRLTDVLGDGRVRVVGLEDGLERTLVSDYFF